MSVVEAAIAFACKVHAGQIDKAGQPYILHPLRLMLKFSGDEQRVAAVLHDAVEDCGVGLAELQRLGISTISIDAIYALTRREGESYERFIHRLSKNRIATEIKIEDIRDNLNLERLDLLDEKDVRRILKYHRALMFLLSKRAIPSELD